MTIRISVEIVAIARAIVERWAVDARQFTQDFWADTTDFSRVPKPEIDSPLLLIISAALVQLFASRPGDKPPEWTANVRGLSMPLFLVPEFEHIPF